jgi:hypothetical protein
MVKLSSWLNAQSAAGLMAGASRIAYTRAILITATLFASIVCIQPAAELSVLCCQRLQ